MTDWDGVAARWLRAGHDWPTVNRMLAQVHADGTTRPPTMPKPARALPPQPSYGQTVAQAVYLARQSMAQGTPRDHAARAFRVPVRLWARL